MMLGAWYSTDSPEVMDIILGRPKGVEPLFRTLLAVMLAPLYVPLRLFDALYIRADALLHSRYKLQVKRRLEHLGLN